MKRKPEMNIFKIFGLKFLVNLQIRYTCQNLENEFWENYEVSEPNSLKDILEWFFLDRRYRTACILCENAWNNGKILVFKVKGGKYLVSVEHWPKNSAKDTWVSQRTSSEKEVLHLCQDFFEPQDLRFEVS